MKTIPKKWMNRKDKTLNFLDWYNRYILIPDPKKGSIINTFIK